MSQHLKDCALLQNSDSITPILNIVDVIVKSDRSNLSYASVWIMYGLKNESVIENRHLAKLLTILAIKTSHEGQVDRADLADYERRTL